MNEIETVYKLKLKNVTTMKSGKIFNFVMIHENVFEKTFQRISKCKQN